MKLHLVGAFLLTIVCAVALVMQTRVQPEEVRGVPVLWIAGAAAGIAWIVWTKLRIWWHHA